MDARRGLFVFCIIGLLLGLVPAVSVTAEAPKLYLNVASGPPGTTVDIYGYNWTPGHQIFIAFWKPTGSKEMETTVRAISDGPGYIGAKVQVPADATPKTLKIVAKDLDGSGTFEWQNIFTISLPGSPKEYSASGGYATSSSTSQPAAASNTNAPTATPPGKFYCIGGSPGQDCNQSNRSAATSSNSSSTNRCVPQPFFQTDNPASPSNLRVTDVNDTTISLVWQDNSNTECGFHVYWYDCGTTEGQYCTDNTQQTFTTDTNVTSVTINVPKLAEFYCFSVSSFIPASDGVNIIQGGGTDAVCAKAGRGVLSMNKCLGAAAFPLNDYCVTVWYRGVDTGHLKISDVKVCAQTQPGTVFATFATEVDIWTEGKLISSSHTGTIVGASFVGAEGCTVFSPNTVVTRKNVGVWAKSIGINCPLDVVLNLGAATAPLTPNDPDSYKSVISDNACTLENKDSRADIPWLDISNFG